MGNTEKKNRLVQWLKSIHADKNVFTRIFFTIDDLYSIFCNTIDKDTLEQIKFNSFKRLIDSICRNKSYRNLKKRIGRRCENKRNNEYILVDNKELDVKVDDLKVYVSRRKKKKHEYVTKKHKSPTSSIPKSPNTTAAIAAPTPSPGDTTAADAPTPSTLPVAAPTLPSTVAYTPTPLPAAAPILPSPVAYSLIPSSLPSLVAAPTLPSPVAAPTLPSSLPPAANSQFPLLQSLGIETNFETNSSTITNLLSELIRLYKKHNKKMEFVHLGNSKPGIVVAVPRSKDYDSFNKNERRFKWLETIMEYLKFHQDSTVSKESVVTWFVCYISSKFPHDFVQVASEKGLHIRQIMSSVEAAAMWTESNVSITQARIILRHLH